MPLVTRTGQVSFAPKGDKGDKGARMRMRVWEASVSYLEGKQGQQFYDIVLYDNCCTCASVRIRRYRRKPPNRMWLREK